MENNNGESKEEKVESTQQENSNANLNDGISQGEESLRNTVEELKKANAEKARLLKEEEKILARREALNALGGDSQKKQEVRHEETPKEYAQKILNSRK